MAKVIKKNVDFSSTPVIFPLLSRLIKDEGFEVRVKGSNSSDLKLLEYMAKISLGSKVPEVAFYEKGVWYEGYFAFHNGVWIVADTDVMERSETEPLEFSVRNGNMLYSYFLINYDTVSSYPIDLVRYLTSFMMGISSAKVEVRETTDTTDYINGKTVKLHSVKIQ